MSTSLSTTLSLIAKQVSIYFGIPMLILGIIGNILAITVLLSLQTFRRNSCSFYLIIMQIFNIGELLSGLTSRILINGFNIDLTGTSRIFCKLRPFSVQVFASISLTCLCLATIDQYFATCSRQSWQRLSNLKLAHYLVIIFVLLWSIHGIPYLIFVDIIDVPFLRTSYCLSTNSFFSKYHNYFVFIILLGFLPVIILTIFGCLAYYNVRHMNYRTVPLVRQELDKQLTVMVLLQVFLNISGLLPYAISSAISLIPQIINDSIGEIYVTFLNTIFSILFYLYFAGSFYIYICASERFRRQVIYVIFKIHFNRWQRQKQHINQIIPRI